MPPHHPESPHEYDVFLSHSSLDKAVVSDVTAYLRKQGIKPDLFTSLLLQTLENLRLLRWACFERHRVLTNTLRLSKLRPPRSHRLSSVFATKFVNRSGKVWFDEEAIEIGGSIPSDVHEGLTKSRHVVLCMSPAYFESPWCKRELDTAIMQDPGNDEAHILPLLIKPYELLSKVKHEMLSKIKHLRFTDYTSRQDSVLEELSNRILSTRPAPTGATPDLLLTPPGLVRAFLDRWCPSFHRWLTSIGAFGFTFPPEYRALEAYNEEVYSSTSRQLYDQTIVKLRAKSLDSKPNQPLPRGRGFHSPIQQVVREIEGREENQDAASATISALSRSSRPVRNLVARLLSDDEPLVLLGEPGAGKSLSIHQARIVVADKNRKRVFPDIGIYIPLGEFHVESGEVTDAALAEFVRSRVDASIRPYLSALRRSHRLVVFLDGMDEMSRRRYNDHVEAISDYARAGEGKAKTVVACRTADFSPKFQHRRFVLLPFGKSQILSYLRLQFHSSTVLINGRHWSLKELGRELLRGDLSINATSPYVLWMFCRFIQDEEKWPDSRVQLLQHYYQVRLRDHFTKIKQACNDETISTAFAIWGRIAFQLAIAHRGVSISIKDLHQSIGREVVDEGVRLGRAAGALEMSLPPGEDPDTALIKFEHHRAAEFFTAWHIHATGEPVPWEELLDYPRWRETLLNVLLLGGSAHARLAVEQALQNAAHLTPETTDWRQERALVERVEFAARAHTDAHQSPAFAEQLAAAVYNLAENGNPTTRIKMLEIARRTPDVDVYRVAEPSVNSDVQYLRTQALIIASASGNASSQEFLPDKFLFAFAKGEFFSRLPELSSVVVGLKQWRPLLLLLCGVFFFIISPVVQLAAVWSMAFGVEEIFAAKAKEPAIEKKHSEELPLSWYLEWQEGFVRYFTGNASILRSAFEMDKQSVVESEKQNADNAAKPAADKESAVTGAQALAERQTWKAVSSMIASPWAKAGLVCIALVCCLVGAFTSSKYRYVSALIGGAIGLVLTVVGTLMWLGQDGLAVVILVITYGVFNDYVCIHAPVRILFVICLFVYAWCVSLICKKAVAWNRYIGCCWNPNSDSLLKSSVEFWTPFVKVLLFVPFLPVYMLVMDIVGSSLPSAIAQRLTDPFLLVPFFMGPASVLFGLFYMRVELRGRSIISKLFYVTGKILVGVTRIVLGIIVMVLGVIFIIIIIGNAIKEVNHKPLTVEMAISAGIAILHGLVYAIGLLIAWLVFWLCWLGIQKLRKEIDVRILPVRDKQTWQQKFAAADASHQALLLQHLSADQLRLKPEEFLEFLAETCQPLLQKGDPPESDFWRKYQEANDLARLEREGK